MAVREADLMDSEGFSGWGEGFVAPAGSPSVLGAFD